jgi:EAL domain-containing protein (putative c-di-GMP-specific phosphodiesterase class I)
VCGCTHAQGFLLGKPVNGDEIAKIDELLAAHSEEPASNARS